MHARTAGRLTGGVAMVSAVVIGLSAFTMSADAAPRHRSAPVAVFIGDSFTQGTGASDSAHAFAALVARKEKWRLVNLGRGGTGYVTASGNGQLSCGMPYCGPYGERVDDAMVKKPAVVIVSGGINDLSAPLPVFRSGVDQLLAALKAHLPKRTFIAVTAPQWPDADRPEAFVREVAAVRASARAHKVHFLDIGQPLASGVDVKAADGVHPDDAGHEALARVIERRLRVLRHP